ncbi:hypothetical protein ScPMuIL_014860 [Solemya velum]
MADEKDYSPSPFINDFSQMFAMKGKRRRTMISSAELEQLENYFLQDMWPSRKKKELLAQQMCKSERFVDIWFQNRRARMRRLSKEKDTHQEDGLPRPTNRVPSNVSLNVGLLDLGADQAAMKMNEVKPIFRSDDVKPIYRADDVRLSSSNQVDTSPGWQNNPVIVTANQSAANTTNQTPLNTGMSPAGDVSKKSVPTNVGKSTTVGLNQSGVLVQTNNQTNMQAIEGLLWRTQRRLLLMAAAAEGVLLPNHSGFNRAVSDVTAGIQLKDARLFYDELGFDFETLS